MTSERAEPELPPSYDEALADVSPTSSRVDTKQVVRSLVDETISYTSPEDSSSKLSPGPSSPPLYARHDPAANAFILRTPFIYTSSGFSDTPRYQIEQSLTRSGRPYKLHIRTLAPSETRRLSLQGPAAQSAAFTSFDDDLLVYEVQGLGFIGSSRVEIKGCRSRCLPGYIQVETGIGWSCKFWHMTRNEAADAMRPENERRMQKHGYHSRDEWNRNLLFAVDGRRTSAPSSDRKYEWKDATGKSLGVEKEQKLELTAELTMRSREALLACWIGRAWISGALSQALVASGGSRSISSV